MRRRGKSLWGILTVLAGVVIIMALVLPGKFWWFLLAGALIMGGCWLIRCL